MTFVKQEGERASNEKAREKSARSPAPPVRCKRLIVGVSGESPAVSSHGAPFDRLVLCGHKCVQCEIAKFSKIAMSFVSEKRVSKSFPCVFRISGPDLSRKMNIPWEGGTPRPPLGGGGIVHTTLCIYSIDVFLVPTDETQRGKSVGTKHALIEYIHKAWGEIPLHPVQRSGESFKPIKILCPGNREFSVLSVPKDVPT